MNYQFNFTSAQTEINQDSFIVSLIVGLTCSLTDENGETWASYREERIKLEPARETLTVNEVRDICMNTAILRNWYNELPLQIEKLRHQPKVGENFVI